MDLFYSNINSQDSDASKLFTITELDPERRVTIDEINSANAYSGGAYEIYKRTDSTRTVSGIHANIPFYSTTCAEQGEVIGNICHHYRQIPETKSGYKAIWVETLIYFTALLTRPLLNGQDNLTNAFWKIKDTQSSDWVELASGLDDSSALKNKMQSYRKTLVSTLCRSLPTNKGAFITDIINREPPRIWKEEGREYSAFAQLEFLSTFRGQLIERQSPEDNITRGDLKRFPIYCYVDDNNQNIVFPSWSEIGVFINGIEVKRFEDKIDYNFAKLYYGDEFINDILSPVTGFGFISKSKFDRTNKFHERLLGGLELLNSENEKLNVGSKRIVESISKALKEQAQYDSVAGTQRYRTLESYVRELAISQLWTPLIEMLYLLQFQVPDTSTENRNHSLTTDVVIGSHVNTFKSKFDIQNFQLKLNIVRLDINLLKECTAFELKEIEFSDNQLLTLDTINPVGNPQELFLPITIKTKAEKVETVKSRKVEIKTDYLLETLSDIDVMSLMNNIWYRIDEEGNRIVLSPTELARVPIFRNNPGIMFTNDYEPVLKNKLTQNTPSESMELKKLTHVDGGDVRGVNPNMSNNNKYYDDKTWSGMGWCLNGMGKRLGFTSGLLHERVRDLQVKESDGYSNDKNYLNDDNKKIDQLNATQTVIKENSWFIERFGLLETDETGYDASSNVIDNTNNLSSLNAYGNGAFGSMVYGSHRQKLHPSQNTGGFVRSAWLAERLATVVFGKQDFPSFHKTTDVLPFNKMNGDGQGGKISGQYNKDYHKSSTDMLTIIADSEFGRLKLADVQQDDSARGQLRDFRYPGPELDIHYNVPIFAESVPNTNGTFACQVIRMVKSGLVGRPEDNKILIKEQDIVDQINGGVYMAFDTDSESNMIKNPSVKMSVFSNFPSGIVDASGQYDDSSTATLQQAKSQFKNVVLNPQQFMYLKLQEKRTADKNKPYEGGFVAMQYVLQQLLSNDPQRFILNESESKRPSDFVTIGTKDYNPEYKGWRSKILDSGLPTDDVLLNAANIDVSNISVNAKPVALQVLPDLDRGANWNVHGTETAIEPQSSHPLALCIRGLDLDHCLMTYKDLSKNTHTPYAITPSGEILQGLHSDSEIIGKNVYNEDIKNKDVERGHLQREGWKEKGKYTRFGPRLYSTEGNLPFMEGSIAGPERHKNITTNATNDDSIKSSLLSTKHYTQKEGVIDKSKSSVTGKSGNLAGWNSYIKHTDLTKTYPIYMLPLMKSDTISIIVTNEGSLKDPLENMAKGPEDSFRSILKDISTEIKGWSKNYTDTADNINNINNTTGTGELTTVGNAEGAEAIDTTSILADLVEETTTDSPAITGHGEGLSAENNSVTLGNKGIYYNCINLLVAPELGPYERRQVATWRAGAYGHEEGSEADLATTATYGMKGYGEGTSVKNASNLTTAITHGTTSIDTNWNKTTLNGFTAALINYDPYVKNGFNFKNSLHAYYTYLGMVNKINPGGSSGKAMFSAAQLTANSTSTTTTHTGITRAHYLAVDMSNVPISDYYQKFVTRSFTIKYKLDDSLGINKDYNDIRIEQVSADEAEAYKVKDDLSLPRKDIFDSESEIRYDYENYKNFWDPVIAETEGKSNDVNQMITAKPVLLSSTFTEISKAEGSILIPRRFDGRPMDPSVPGENIICIRKDAMILISKVTGKQIDSPSQEECATQGTNALKFKFSLDLGLPLQGGGLIRCKLPLESASKDSFAYFQDPEFTRDYLVFNIRDWKGNSKDSGGNYQTIPKANMLANLHDAMQRSQIAQLNERLLQPYTSAISTRYQPPPNQSYQMPILLPTKPGGANIRVDGASQRRVFFQPLNLVINPLSGGENNFDINPVNESYYVRISANNKNWLNYKLQALKADTRKTATLTFAANKVPNLPIGTVLKCTGGSTDSYWTVFKKQTTLKYTVCLTKGTTPAIANTNITSFYVPSSLETTDLSDAIVPTGASTADYNFWGSVNSNTPTMFRNMPSLEANANTASDLTADLTVDTISSAAAGNHPQFSEMDGSGNIDLSAVIHNVAQSQLLGEETNCGTCIHGTGGKRVRSSVYSLDLLALLNTTYDATTKKWTHRKNSLAAVVDKSDVFSSDTVKDQLIDDLVVLEANLNSRGQPILVISDIGKTWSDYEGLMLNKERYNRLCDVLGEPDANYALAIDDIGSQDVGHGDLDLKGVEKKFYGKYTLADAAKWDVSSAVFGQAETMNQINGGTETTIQNKLNNPLQHLYQGGYFTMDDPTTGGGCIGRPRQSDLKSRYSKFSYANRRKQFQLVNNDGTRSIHINSNNKFDTGRKEGNVKYAYFKYRTLPDTNITKHATTTYKPLDASRVVHPSKYVFEKIIDNDYNGKWVGGNTKRTEDRNQKNGLKDNTNSSEFTMDYIAYSYKASDIYGAKKEFLDCSGAGLSGSGPGYLTGDKNTTKTWLKTNHSLNWVDYFGASNFYTSDGYIDNSRFRTSGSIYYVDANDKIKERGTKMETKYNQNVESTFTLHTSTDSATHQPRAWMSESNQENYWNAIKFLSTNKATNTSSDTKAQKTEKRMANSEKEFLQSKSTIIELK